MRMATDTVNTCVMSPEEAKEKYHKKTILGGIVAAILGSLSMTKTAFAASAAPAPGQEMGIVGNAVDFLLNLLMGVGICFIAFGVISLAISFQSHDDSQKSKAVMAIVGGAIAVSVPWVLDALLGSNWRSQYFGS